MNDAAVVGRFLRDYAHRGLESSAVRRISGSVHGASVAYLVRAPAGPPFVVRACRADASVPVQYSGSAARTMPDWLLSRAATLICLEHAGYPAPRVIRTRAGDPIGLDGIWRTLATSYVAGRVAVPTAAQLRMLGAALGELHTIAPVPRPGQAAWHPAAAIPATLARLGSIEALLPGEWRPMHAQFRRTVLAVQRALGEVPDGVVHGDSWPGNVVQSGPGTVTLIDWDTGGLGLPVLDLGNCLLESLLDARPRAAGPEGWHVQPDEARIAAVAGGYAARRALTAGEHALLPEAIRFGAAYVGAIHFEQALAGGVHGASMDARLGRLRNRLAVSQPVADLAARYLAAGAEPVR